MNQQLSFFPESKDFRPPVTVTWNGWHAWFLDTHMQCVEYGIPFYFHQTGARLRKGNRVYEIPREHQHSQAHKAHLDFDGTRLPAWDEPDMEED